MAITKNERLRSALNSAEEYERLKRCDRHALSAGDISERHFAALREARMPGSLKRCVSMRSHLMLRRDAATTRDIRGITAKVLKPENV